MQVFHQVHNRGGERVANDIENGLRKRGHDISTIAVKWREPDSPVAEVVKDVRVFADKSGMGSNVVVAIARLLRHLIKERPDAILMHTTAAGFVVAPITRLAGIRQRVLIHHNAIGTNQGGLWVPLEKLYGATGMYSDIVFVSDRSHELISDWPDPYLKRASVIFNGIELPAPESQMTRQAILERHGLSPDTLLAISVGSLEAQKNQRVLVEALAGTSGVHLIIAGEGSKRPEIESAIKRTNAPVTLLGNIEMEEVSALFHECDVLLFPSIHEGRALTLLEAADSGIGIIASDIPENVSVLCLLYTSDAADE